MRLTNMNINKVLNQKQYTVKHGLGSQYVAEQKLGQLEDIEEELGIDLIILFNAIKNGIYVKCEYDLVNIKAELFKNIYLRDTQDGFMFFDLHSMMVYLKDYGKTWALTKEELKDE